MIPLSINRTSYAAPLMCSRNMTNV